MSCAPFRDQLSAHLDGELAPEMSSSLRAHLEACSACRDELRELEIAREVLVALPPERPPAGWSGGVLSTLRGGASAGASAGVLPAPLAGEPASPPTPGFPSRRRFWPVAVAALLLLALSWGLGHWTGSRSGDSRIVEPGSGRATFQPQSLVPEPASRRQPGPEGPVDDPAPTPEESEDSLVGVETPGDVAPEPGDVSPEAEREGSPESSTDALVERIAELEGELETERERVNFLAGARRGLEEALRAARAELALLGEHLERSEARSRELIARLASLESRIASGSDSDTRPARPDSRSTPGVGRERGYLVASTSPVVFERRGGRVDLRISGSLDEVVPSLLQMARGHEDPRLAALSLATLENLLEIDDEPPGSETSPRTPDSPTFLERLGRRLDRLTSPDDPSGSSSSTILSPERRLERVEEEWRRLRGRASDLHLAEL